MLSRRQWLKGNFSGKPNEPTPPWAIKQFFESCSRCDACIAACPTRILVRGDGGFPRVDFRSGECSFCGACAEACQARALVRRDGAPPWKLVAAIDDSCLCFANVICRSCGEQCDADAIHFTLVAAAVARPSVAADRCSGCGACVAPCPNGAILITEHHKSDIRRVA